MALNKPFTDSHSRGTKQPCWRARDALGWDKQSKLPFYMAGAPSIQPKLSKIWKQRQWCRNFRKSFQKFWKLLNFRNANHSTENSGNSGSKVEWKGNFREKAFSKIWVYLARFSSGLEILENAVPFATGSCQKFKPDVLVEWKAPTMYMYPWMFCTMTNCKGPINSYQCNLTLWIVELWYADYTLAIIKNVLYK